MFTMMREERAHKAALVEKISALQSSLVRLREENEAMR